MAADARHKQLPMHVRKLIREVVVALTNEYSVSPNLLALQIHLAVHDILPVPDHQCLLDVGRLQAQLGCELLQSTPPLRPLIVDHITGQDVPPSLALREIDYCRGLPQLRPSPCESDDGFSDDICLSESSSARTTENVDEAVDVGAEGRLLGALQCKSGVNYEECGGILRLLPSTQQWRDFSGLIKVARELGAEDVGIFTIQLPGDVADQELASLVALAELSTSQYKSVSHMDKIFKLDRTVVSVKLGSDQWRQQQNDSQIDGQGSASLEKFETDLRQDSCFDHVYYCTDLPANEPEERITLGLPSTSPLADLQGDRLLETTEKVDGLHSIFAYRSCAKFGSPFALHVEDWNLFSVNYLREGRKTIITIAPNHYEKLIQKCRDVKPPWFNKRCSQILRHASVYIPTATLEEWDISYSVLEQTRGDVFITFPRAAHQGFSHGFTDAEAKNYADNSWDIIQYKECNQRCSKNVIPRWMMEPRDKETDSSDHLSARFEYALRTTSEVSAQRQTSQTFRTAPPQPVQSVSKEGKRKTGSCDLPAASKKPKKSTKPASTLPEVITAVTAQPLRVEESCSQLPRRVLDQLIFAIGSPETVACMRGLYATVHARKLEDQVSSFHSDSPSTMQRLDNLNASVIKTYLLRRYYLVTLFEERQALHNKHKRAPFRLRDTSSPSEGRVDKQVHDQMVRDQYPGMNVDVKSAEFRRRVQSLKHRLARAKRWFQLQQSFSSGILLWIPVGEKWATAGTEYV